MRKKSANQDWLVVDNPYHVRPWDPCYWSSSCSGCPHTGTKRTRTRHLQRATCHKVEPQQFNAWPIMILIPFLSRKEHMLANFWTLKCFTWFFTSLACFIDWFNHLIGWFTPIDGWNPLCIHVHIFIHQYDPVSIYDYVYIYILCHYMSLRVSKLHIFSSLRLLVHSHGQVLALWCSRASVQHPLGHRFSDQHMIFIGNMCHLDASDVS